MSNCSGYTLPQLPSAPTVGSADLVYLVPGSGTLSGNANYSATVGQIQAGVLVSGCIQSGMIASGVQCPAGSVWDNSNYRVWGIVSGGQTIYLNSSGYVQPADPGLSGYQSIFGVSMANQTSGLPASLMFQGIVQSVAYNFSGYLGRRVYGWSSGSITSTPTLTSGQALQVVGWAINGSGLRVQIDDTMIQLRQ